MIARELPESCRLHTVGVGPAVNRTLTSGAARAGRGAEIVVGLGENPMPAVARLLARLEAPLLTDLVLAGSALFDHAPAALPDVHASAPALIGLRLQPEGGELWITGRLGGRSWEELIQVPAMIMGEGNAAVIACYGREAVEDLEMRVAAGEGLDGRIETLGLDFHERVRQGYLEIARAEKERVAVVGGDQAEAEVRDAIRALVVDRLREALGGG